MKNTLSKNQIRVLSTFAAVAALFAIGCTKNEPDVHASHDDHEHHGDHKHHDDSEHHHEDTHQDDGEKSEGGPNGGRLITSVEPAVEFIVQDDRTVAIQLLDKNRKEVTPTNQVITLIGGDRTNPTTLSFAKKGNRLVSDKPIPEGTSVPVVLQIMASANAAVVREKFNVNLSECPTCDYQEYACVCGHDDH